MIIEKFDKSDTIQLSEMPSHFNQDETLLSILGKNIIIISQNESFDDYTICRLINQQNCKI